ncbi:MAG TPA: DUF5668 domain-containing protein [Actinomycetota bacterium]|nr:DUF5668 domain-containing protein [Actinomycetota bacterium]
MADPGVSRGAIAAGVAFVVAGVVFLLEGLGVWDLDIAVLGPALLIGIGIVVLLGGRPRA